MPEMPEISEMIDILFDLDGGTLPAAYPCALWAALIRHVPQLAEEKFVGVFPLRGTENNEAMLLPKRAKLVLRLPAALADQTAARLTGQQLDVAGITMRLGSAKSRPIRPYPTIHAQLVTGSSDELLFMDSINIQLSEMGIKGKLICGKRRTISGNQPIHGFSLVLHDLKPEASLRLQYAGLGQNRQFGCGIFVPYKVISGLSDD
jgi:CRISPR-associated protein Cas6